MEKKTSFNKFMRFFGLRPLNDINKDSLALRERVSEGQERGQKVAFTLAEVLITIGVIGVVAAMTIPTLIANTNGQKFRSQFKKTISTLSQAGRMSQAQYGFDYAGISAWGNGNANPETEKTIEALLNGTVKGTFLGMCTPKTSGYAFEGLYGTDVQLTTFGEEDMYFYQLSDGSLVGYSMGFDTNCSLTPGENLSNVSQCRGFIDVNGGTKPNKEVTCSNGTDTMFVWDENYEDCVVKNDANHMTDIFPIVFHDSIVEPATNAAKYVLNTAK